MNEKDPRLDDFLAKYGDMVAHKAYQILRDYHTAQDIAQETFIKFGRELDQIPDWKVKSWLLVTARNLAIDHLRKGGKYTVVVGLYDELYFDRADEQTDPCLLMIKREEVEERLSVLQRLAVEKPNWYDAVILSEVTGWTNEEIGRELGVSAALVSKWKERARRWLCDAYLEEEQKERDS